MGRAFISIGERAGPGGTVAPAGFGFGFGFDLHGRPRTAGRAVPPGE